MIEQQKIELDKANKEQKDSIKDRIEELEKIKKDIGVQRGTIVTPTEFNSGYRVSGNTLKVPTQHHVCSQCGFGFVYMDTSNPYILKNIYTGIDKTGVKCPKCGNVDRV